LHKVKFKGLAALAMVVMQMTSISAAFASDLKENSSLVSPPIGEIFSEPLYRVRSAIADERWLNSIEAAFLRLFPEYERSASECTSTPGSAVHFRSTDKRAPDVTIALAASEKVNAVALPEDKKRLTPARIVLSRGLLGEITSISELAFVLGHEMAHIRNDFFAVPLPGALLSGEAQARISRIHRNWEQQADREALAALSRAGFDVTSAPVFIDRLEKFESDVENSSHPKHAERRELIRQFALYIHEWGNLASLVSFN
jgi:hypothetical protein